METESSTKPKSLENLFKIWPENNINKVSKNYYLLQRNNSQNLIDHNKISKNIVCTTKQLRCNFYCKLTNRMCVEKSWNRIHDPVQHSVMKPATGHNCHLQVDSCVQDVGHAACHQANDVPGHGDWQSPLPLWGLGGCQV